MKKIKLIRTLIVFNDNYIYKNLSRINQIFNMPYIACNGDLYDDEDVFGKFEDTLICDEEDFEEDFLEKDDLIDKWEFRLMSVR